MKHRIASTTRVYLSVAATLLASTLLASSAGCGNLGASPPDEGSSPDGEALSDGEHQGEATFYTRLDEGGHCSFGSTGLTFFGAINHAEYAGAATCGACAEIRGPEGSVKVRITNECPECAPGDIDLSEQAFAELAPMSRGRIPISWDYVPCNDISGPIVYRFKEGSNPFWAGLQIRNHVRPIASVEVQKDGNFVSLKREPFNFFIADGGLGPGPYTVRVTDDVGDVIEDSGIELRPTEDVSSPGNHQFPGGSEPGPEPEPKPEPEPEPQPEPPVEDGTAGFTFRVRENVNAWWIQLAVDAPPGEEVERVTAEVNGVTVALDYRSWGDWAGSPPNPISGGARVVFKAYDFAGHVGTSTSAPWPGG